MGYIAGIGGANMDVHGQSLAPIVMRDSNPGRLHLSMGGVMRNVLENLARLGYEVRPATVVGDDAYGDALRAGCERLGMDTRWMHTRPGHTSSSYISIMDSEGDMLVAMSDMRILKELDAAFVEQCLPMLNDAELVVCDGNLSYAAIECLARKCTRPLYLDPVSTAWARSLEPLIGAFDTIKPNRLEMEVLAGMPIQNEADLSEACDRVLARGVRRIFVSLGADGLYCKTRDGARHGRSHGFDRMVNATGAGDATLAGIVYATLSGMDEARTMEVALASGLIAISAPDTISEEMNRTNLETMIKEYVR